MTLRRMLLGWQSKPDGTDTVRVEREVCISEWDAS